MAARCPRCGRPVATTRPECVYCGERLPEAPAPRRAEAADAAAPASTRVLLVLDLAQAETSALRAALGLSAYEASLRVRRGGFQLQRVLEAEAGEAERTRLARSGIGALAIPEQEVLAAHMPRAVAGGRMDAGTLRLRLVDGERAVLPGAAACIVRGPILREYQTDDTPRRVHASTLADAYRIHLYLGDDPRPLELDPAAFDFTGAERRAASSLLELLGWIEGVAHRAIVDTDFARVPPALAPAHGKPLAETAALLGQGAPRRPRGSNDDEGRVILDNLGQFRHYSGWRAAVARRLGR